MPNAMMLNPEARRGVTKMVMTLFQLWQLSSDEQCLMLGHSAHNRAVLRRYRKGQPLANQRDRLERAAILLQIHHYLRRAFSLNPELAYGWMRQANRAFYGKTPVQLISQHGMMGSYIVRAYLVKQLS